MRRNQKGFSLIELLTVMAVISITVAVAIPMGMNYIRHYEVIGAAQNVATSLTPARTCALTAATSTEPRPQSALTARPNSARTS